MKRIVIDYITSKDIRSQVMSFPEIEAINIEKIKQKIKEVEAYKYMSDAEKAEKIARYNAKIAEIQKSVEFFYMTHPQIERGA